MSQAAPGDRELRRLTSDQLCDGRYHLPLRGDEDTPMRLHPGRGSVKYGEGASEQVHAGLVRDLVAFGDLDGDLVVDAAARNHRPRPTVERNMCVDGRALTRRRWMVEWNQARRAY